MDSWRKCANNQLPGMLSIQNDRVVVAMVTK